MCHICIYLHFNVLMLKPMRKFNICSSPTGALVYGDVGHYTCQKYNGKSTIGYVLLSATFIPYISNFHVDVIDKSLSDAHSPICLDLIFENPTRKHMKKISESENYNKQDKHLIEYKKLLDVRKKVRTYQLCEVQ